jgi:hypothetical protein
VDAHRQTEMDRYRFAIGAALLLALSCALAACAAVGPGASSSAVDADRAVALVLSQDPRFGGIEARDPQLIGQAAWYEVAAEGDGWKVTVRIGWGDCPSGCINEHTWTYSVTAQGSVALASERGDVLPGQPGIGGVAMAGPTCPVVRDPPDSACADRPVVGAVLVLEDSAGREVARATTQGDGRFWIAVAPGSYRLVPQPVEGLLGTAQPMEVSVAVGEPVADLLVSYDTGIR